MSTARIGVQKVIPAIQASPLSEVVAIASRKLTEAQKIAEALHIPLAYGSYEALLEADRIDAVYIPLPNHLHVPWALRAIKAGKHVLCEKPLALSANELSLLWKASQEVPHLKIMEAFMYRFHPQWAQVKKLLEEGAIGPLNSIQASFSFYNDNPDDIRNNREMGGGALMDIGSYCISLARWLFDKEPLRVMGLSERHPIFDTDVLTTGLLDFGTGSASFICSTQLVPQQRAYILGITGSIEVNVPFTPSANQPAIIRLRKDYENEQLFQTEAIDQYRLQADLFAEAILSGIDVPTTLDDAFNNMRVMDAISESAVHNGWVGL